MNFAQLKKYIASDLFRYAGRCSLKSFLRYYFFGRGFHYTFWMRVTRYLSTKPLLKPLFFISRLNLYRLSTKYGIEIGYQVEVGYGLYIGHFGCVVVSNMSSIGHNVNLSQGVTLGQANRGKNAGAPSLGDEVYIGPGAKIVGAVNIKSFTAIGVNAVVTKDSDEFDVLVGIPAKSISKKGSDSYIHNRWVDL